MKKILQLSGTILTVLTLSSGILRAQGWVQKANFPNINTTAIGFSVGSKGYVWGGSINKNVSYDPSADTWTDMADIPTRGTGLVGMKIGDKVYIGLGSGAPDSLYEYNPANDTYTPKGLYGGHQATFRLSFAIGNKGYVFGGMQIPGTNDSMYEYNPATDAWTFKCMLPQSGASSANSVAMAVGNRGYLIVAGSIIYEYNPETNEWSTKRTISSIGSLNGMVGCTVGNKLVIGTGSHPTNFSNRNKFYAYDPAADSLSELDTLPVTPGFANGILFAIGSKVYYTLGVEGFMGFNTRTWELETNFTTPTSLRDASNVKALSVSVYPNPANEFMYIDTNEPASFEIMSIDGKSTGLSGAITNNQPIHIASLMAGAYFIKITSASGTTMQKWFKQ